MFSSLPVVLLAVLGGITAVSGALVGGLVLAGFPGLADEITWLESLAILGPVIIGITLARRPDGLVLQLSDAWSGRRRNVPPGADELPDRAEELVLTMPFGPAHRVAIDHELALDA